MALSSAQRVLSVARAQMASAFSERERRWIWVTELPFLGCAIAIAFWLEPQRDLDLLVCFALVVAYAVARHVRIALPDRGIAASTQLVFVPMLLLAPLNLVPLMVLAAGLAERVVSSVRDGVPLPRVALSLGNSWYALAPVLVLAAAGESIFAWSHWPVYAGALAAQLAFDVLIGFTLIRLHVGKGKIVESLRAPFLIDIVLSVPALGVVAVAGEAPVAAALMLAALLAIASGFTSEHSHRLAERERAELDARSALMEERVRIARELHDVVAHHVSVIGVQSGAARVVLTRDPVKAKEMLSLIESSSRQAVHELHLLLGFLRQDGEADDRGPQPGLGQVHELASTMSDSQLAVEVRVEGEPYVLAPTVDASAYRIVQEALTNTLKHAGASRADVRVRYGPDELELEISDDGNGAGAPSTPGGLGLIGMRERATLHGGELVAGPSAGGGFRVRATLPSPGGMR